MSQKIRYEVGQHTLEVDANKGRWTAARAGRREQPGATGLRSPWYGFPGGNRP